MPNKNIDAYRSYKSMGVKPEEAARMAGVSKDYAYAASLSDQMPYDNTYLVAEQVGNGVYGGGAIATAAGALGMDLEHMRAASSFPAGLDDGARWYDGVLDTLFDITETVAAPQQMLWRAMSKDDWRKAVPDWLAPEEWKEQGIEHEFIMIGDVVDAHIDGGFHKMLAELDKGGFFEKWVLGGGLKVTEFAADAVLDPMNVVIGAGVFSKATRAARRLLPIAAQAEHAAKLAVKSKALPDIADALKKHDAWIFKLTKAAKDEGSDVAKVKLAKAVEQRKTLFDDWLYYNDAHPTLDLVPAMRPAQIAKPAKNASRSQWAKYELQTLAAEHYPPFVRFEDLDESAHAMRLVFGPDDAEMAGEGIYRMLSGADGEKILLRNVLDDVMPTSTSTELRPRGIGRDGTVTKELAESRQVYDKVVSHTEAALTQQKILEREIAVAKKMKNPSKAHKARTKDLEKQAKELKTRVSKGKAEMEHYGKTGRFSKVTTDDFNLELPSGPRRSIMSASDFVETSGERLGTKVFTPMLYPDSFMPTAKGGFMSYFFREPMRVLESHMPGAWNMMEGAQRGKQAFVQGHAGKLNRILHDAGVKVSGGGKIRAAAAQAGIKGPSKLVKEKDELLFDLLNTKKGTAEFDALFSRADESMQKAYKETRELLESFVEKMGLNPDLIIEDYMPHILPDRMFKGGRMPPEFIGTKRVNGTPWFRKVRKGEGGDFSRSATEVLDTYLRGVAKHLYTDPAADGLLRLSKQTAHTTDKKWLVGYAESLVANVRGEPSALGKFLDNIPIPGMHEGARRAAAMMGTLTYSAALTGNIRYPIMSIAQAINTTGAEFGMLRTLKGVARASTAEGKLLTKSLGLDQEHARIFEGFTSTWSGLASELRPLGFSINDTEALIRGITMHTSLDEQLTKLGYQTLDDVTDAAVKREVLAKAVRDSESINHVFGAMGKPVWMGRVSQSGSTLATQFFSFPFKQTETIVNNTMKNPGFLADYLLMAGQMQYIAGKMNIDLAPFIGGGYVEGFLESDLKSIPVDIMGDGISAMQGIFAIDLPSDIRDQRLRKFGESAKMLIPMRTALKQRSSMVAELRSGVRRSTVTGTKKRDLNLSLVAKDPQYGGDSEFASILVRMNSLQETQFKRENLAKRRVEGDRTKNARNLARTLGEAFRNGKNVDPKKISELNRAISRTGVRIGDIDLAGVLSKEKGLYNVIEHLRESESEHATRLRFKRRND